MQSHVNITGNTKIGKNNNIYPFVSIGNDPQDLKFDGEETKLKIVIIIKLENMLLLIQEQKEEED